LKNIHSHTHTHTHTHTLSLSLSLHLSLSPSLSLSISLSLHLSLFYNKFSSLTPADIETIMAPATHRHRWREREWHTDIDNCMKIPKNQTADRPSWVARLKHVRALAEKPHIIGCILAVCVMPCMTPALWSNVVTLSTEKRKYPVNHLALKTVLVDAGSEIDSPYK
jgi:hypothetical protein